MFHLSQKQCVRNLKRREKQMAVPIASIVFLRNSGPRVAKKERTWARETAEGGSGEGQPVVPSNCDAISQKRCNYCSKVVTGSKPLLRCSKCKAVVYCSKICQKEHWLTHKVLCSAIHQLALKERENFPIQCLLTSVSQRTETSYLLALWDRNGL